MVNNFGMMVTGFIEEWQKNAVCKEMFRLVDLFVILNHIPSSLGPTRAAKIWHSFATWVKDDLDHLPKIDIMVPLRCEKIECFSLKVMGQKLQSVLWPNCSLY